MIVNNFAYVNILILIADASVLIFNFMYHITFFFLYSLWKNASNIFFIFATYIRAIFWDCSKCLIPYMCLIDMVHWYFGTCYFDTLDWLQEYWIQLEILAFRLACFFTSRPQDRCQDQRQNWSRPRQDRYKLSRPAVLTAFCMVSRDLFECNNAQIHQDIQHI